MEQKLRHQNLQHQWRQERYPPQLRHEPWTTRGDAVLRPSERPSLQTTKRDVAKGLVGPFRHTSVSEGNPTGAVNFGTGAERAEARCHRKWATRRAPGAGKNTAEPFTRVNSDTAVRDNWLQAPSHDTAARYDTASSSSSSSSSVGKGGNPLAASPPVRRLSLVDDLPPRALAAVASFFDLASFAASELTCRRRWGPALHAAAEAWVFRCTGRVSGLARRLRGCTACWPEKKRNSFHRGGESVESSTESWARCLRFALLLESRLDQAHLGMSPLAPGPNAHHSLVVTPGGIGEQQPCSSSRTTYPSDADGHPALPHQPPKQSATRPSSSRRRSRALQAFGWGKFGQTGLRCLEPQTLPALVEPFASESESRRVVSASCGLTHSLCVDESGLLWGWGEDCCKFGGQRNPSAYEHGARAVPLVTEPRLVPVGPQTTQGKSAPSQSNLPAQVPCSVRVVGACAGARFSLCLDDQGRVWSWGAGSTWGCLGHGGHGHADGGHGGVKGSRGPNSSTNAPPSARDEPMPRRIEFGFGAHGSGGRGTQAGQEEASVVVVALAAGPRHCLAVDSGGALYSWGCGLDGALGQGDTNHRFIPTLVTVPRERDKSNNTTTVVAARGAELGEGRKGPSACSPSSASFAKVFAVAAGGKHTLVITLEGALLSCGSNANGQLGRPASELKERGTTPCGGGGGNSGGGGGGACCGGRGSDIRSGSRGGSINSRRHLCSSSGAFGGVGTVAAARGIPQQQQQIDPWLCYVEDDKDHDHHLHLGGGSIVVDARSSLSRDGDAGFGGFAGTAYGGGVVVGGQRSSSSSSGVGGRESFGDRNDRDKDAQRRFQQQHNQQQPQQHARKRLRWVACAAGASHSLAFREGEQRRRLPGAGAASPSTSPAAGLQSFGLDFDGLGLHRDDSTGYPRQQQQQQQQPCRNAARGVTHERRNVRGSSSSSSSSSNSVNEEGAQACVMSEVAGRGGAVFAWGCNGSGQLGLGEDYHRPAGGAARAGSSLHFSRTAGTVGGKPVRPDVLRPCRVPSLRGVAVDQISAGSEHSLFRRRLTDVNDVNDNGPNKGGDPAAHDSAKVVVFACGAGGQGQLGCVHRRLPGGDVEDRSVPDRVDLNSPFEPKAPILSEGTKSQLYTLQIGNAANAHDGPRLRY